AELRRLARWPAVPGDSIRGRGRQNSAAPRDRIELGGRTETPCAGEEVKGSEHGRKESVAGAPSCRSRTLRGFHFAERGHWPETIELLRHAHHRRGRRSRRAVVE